MAQRLIELELEEHARTKLAVLLSDDGEEKNAKWLPLGEIEIRPIRGKSYCQVTMPEWMATKEGFL